MSRYLNFVCVGVVVLLTILALNVTVLVGSTSPSHGVSIALLGRTVVLDVQRVGACNTGQPDPYPC